MQSIEAGIPKQSLGTRELYDAEHRSRHSQTEFGNEENYTMQSIEAGIPKQSLGTRKRGKIQSL